MHTILAVVVAALVLLILFRGKKSKKSGAPLSSSSAAVDRWMKESLSQVLAGRLHIAGPEPLLLWAGLAGTAAVSLLIAHIAHRALRRELANDP